MDSDVTRRRADRQAKLIEAWEKEFGAITPEELDVARRSLALRRPRDSRASAVRIVRV
jgi:hypothetical protein